MAEFATGQGPNFTRLAQAVSEAVAEAQRRGMEIDECASILVAVAADYGRASYGDQYLTGLAEIVLQRSEMPLPSMREVTHG
ncbi:hypothetical protein [Sinorhizobium sp. CCBAU 05631]|uniref:hypothetical protein n=1 Tax=Sinorhizobium sp. CCBAU 05631 TaxID=794846 RepID=UPI0004B74ED5|nr:hypothetical protein [Sinorhizobium sp. CCBAU 05631]ASY56447.1 hypothetical protein SS05631_c15110 [Sinorhizobium sp. CCBAU 05631]